MALELKINYQVRHSTVWSTSLEYTPLYKLDFKSFYRQMQ